jgi:hypothetical protein
MIVFVPSVGSVLYTTVRAECNDDVYVCVTLLLYIATVAVVVLLQRRLCSGCFRRFGLAICLCCCTGRYLMSVTQHLSNVANRCESHSLSRQLHCKHDVAYTDLQYTNAT